MEQVDGITLQVLMECLRIQLRDNKKIQCGAITHKTLFIK